MAAILFPYRPLAPVLERWQWTTDLIETKDGKETKRAVRDIPRQSWEWPVLVTDRVFNSLLRAQHTLTFLVPSWQEGEVTTSEITAGASTVVVDTDVGDWRTTIIIWASETANETIAISSVGDDIINLSTNVQNTYAAGAVIAPVRTCRLGNLVRQQDDKEISLLRLDWIVLDPTVLDDYDWTVQLLDLDVLDDNYLREGEFVSRSLTAPVTEFDYETGELGFDVQYDSDLWRMPAMTHRVFSPAEMWQWKTWFHKMQGRYGDFWLPTAKTDIILADTFISSDRWLTIENIGYVDYLDAQTTNKGLLFYRPGALAPLARYITDSQAVDADTEQIRLNENLGFAGGPSAFPAISWLHPCRLGTDVVELAYSPGNHTAISVPVKERVLSSSDLEEPEPDPGEYTIALMVASKSAYNYANDYKTALEELDWNVTIYLDSEMPEVGEQTFDVIIAVGFNQTQAANAAMLLAFNDAGLGIIVGCGSSTFNESTSALVAEMGLCLRASQSGSYTVCLDFHQIVNHDILSEREVLPEAIMTKGVCYNGKGYIFDDAEPVGTPIAYARIPVGVQGRQAIGMLVVEKGQDGFANRIIFSGALECENVDELGTFGKRLLDNQVRWVLGDFSTYQSLPLTYSGPKIVFREGLTGAGAKWFNIAGLSAFPYEFDPPGSYNLGNGMVLGAEELAIWSYCSCSGNWLFHCQWIYREPKANNRVGFAFNCQKNHKDEYNKDILDGYVYTLGILDGNLIRYYAAYNSETEEWYQATSVVFSTSADWDGDVLLNTQMQYLEGDWQIRTWREGSQCAPGDFSGGGVSLSDHTSGIVGPAFSAGDPKAYMDVSLLKYQGIS